MQIARGSYTGNGMDDRAITGVGFAPLIVIIKGDNTQPAVYKTDVITGDNTRYLHTGTMFSDGIQTRDSDGFTLGTHASVNANGVTYYYVCFSSSSPNDLPTGTYTGDGTDNRNIDNALSLQPDFVMVDRNFGIFIDTADDGADSTHFFNANADVANYIQDITTTGFQVGSHADVNESGGTYYWLNMRTRTDNFVTGTYTGNGTDDRNITGVGFQPDIVIIKADGSQEAVMRTSSMSGDSSLLLATGGSVVTNRIQSFASDGFQIGTNDQVNTNGTTYHYLAFKADVTGTTTSTSTSTTTSTSTSTTSTSTSTTSTSTTSTSSSTSTTSTSSSTSTTSTSTSTTSTSTSTSTSSSTSTSTTTTLPYIFSIEEI